MHYCLINQHIYVETQRDYKQIIYELYMQMYFYATYVEVTYIVSFIEEEQELGGKGTGLEQKN